MADSGDFRYNQTIVMLSKILFIVHGNQIQRTDKWLFSFSTCQGLKK